MKKGDRDSFDRNWRARDETLYNHWTRGEPANQIQLAFRNHWTLFLELMADPRYRGGKRSLEVGCGRGTMSAYFSDAGFDATLLDISAHVVERAEQTFARDGLAGTFVVGDANDLPFEDGEFDVVVSIGLLEHFEDVAPPVTEQIRVLAPGGLLLCYVVPHYDENVQRDFDWINEVLKGYQEASGAEAVAKDAVFRSDLGSGRYAPILHEHGLVGVTARGVYPVPMISHSIEFPFTLMPEASEAALVAHLTRLLAERAEQTGEHPWLCDEGYGQAFLLWGYRP